MDIRMGDVLICKKNHPCGGNRFEVLNEGKEFHVRCLACGREMQVRRSKFEPNVKSIEHPE